MSTAAKKAPSKAQRAKRWKDVDGTYVDYFEGPHGHYLAWVCADVEGGRIGEYSEEDMVDPKSREERIQWLVYNAAKPHATSTQPEVGMLLFETKRDALAALRAVNFALHNSAIWPAWALEAQAHGWTPPEGWKP